MSETLFQRLCLSQTTNERSDLLIVLNEVLVRSLGIELHAVLLLGDHQQFSRLTDLTAVDLFDGGEQRRRSQSLSQVSLHTFSLADD